MAVICAQCGKENPDGFRFCGACGTALDEAPRRQTRKTVTVLFADVVGSTALAEARDPEAMRKAMGEWFAEARTILERHGGSVEKFVGDAVMAVFGIPHVHEDDALRAVRAAAELRDPAIRIGVNTGEVVAGEGETLVTGDAVNVAARLEQAARPGEVLIGAPTQQLVRDAVEVEPVVPLALKGKAEPVAAYRLLHVDPEAPAHARRHDTPFVARELELALLRQAYDRAVGERRCNLFTILGAAGVGKSRLAAEFLTGVEATVIRGRCLHYGDGITFWPVVEALKQLGERAEPTIARIAEGAGTANELFWDVRKLLERVATERPLVAVFDDLHWSEPTFLDLLDHVADLSREAPILLLCLSRPELLDERPGWAGGKLNATTVLLEPLAPDDTERLLESYDLDEAARQRVIEAAEGNPLFAEEMAVLVSEDGDVAVPPTIQALLAARLDRLRPDERTVIERGAVEGKVFHRSAVAELAPDTAVEPQLASLVRKELIRPDRSVIADDDAFRFRHLLIRDAAYDALPKETRAELHARFADWLERRGSDLVERDEILGYHLEQAALYRAELGQPTDALAASAAELFLSAGRRAATRGDAAAAAGLLSRAHALLAAGTRDDVLIELVRSLLTCGEFERARSAIDELKASSEPRSRAYGTVLEVQLWASVEPALVVSRDEAAAAEAAAILTELRDERGLALAAQARYFVHWMQSRSIPAHEALIEMREHARRSGDLSVERLSTFMASGVLMFGDIPVAEVFRELERIRTAEDSPLVRQSMLLAEGYALGLQGRFEEGLELIAQARAILAELGIRLIHAGTAHPAAAIAILAGQAATAVNVLRRSLRDLEELGDRGYRSTSLAYLAVALLASGEPEEAERAALAAEEISAPDDSVNFALGRTARALVVADRGELDEAERLARSGVEYAFRTDFPLVRGDALAALARVLRRVDRDGEADEALAQAVELYEAKGADACVPRLVELAGASR